MAISQDTMGRKAPPMHQPLTMAIVGFWKYFSRRHCHSQFNRRTLICTLRGSFFMSRKYSLMSIPAEKAVPSPVSTITPQRSSASTSSGLGRFNAQWVVDKFTTAQWVSVQVEYRPF
jgi:hypothetical protein